MAEYTIDRAQFDHFTQKIPRENLIKAIEILGFDAANTVELTLTSSAVTGTAFVRDTEGRKNLAASGCLKFDFTAPIQDEEA